MIAVASFGSPACPLASTRTVSLVDVQPSTVNPLKVSSTARPSARRSVAGGQATSVVRTASIVAMCGASMAAPLAMAPTVNPRPSTTTSLRTVSVVMMAVAASSAAARPFGPGGHQPGDAGLDGRHRERDADEPGLADEDVGAVHPEPLPHQRAHPLGVGHTAQPRRRVGVAAREDHGRRMTVGGLQMRPAHGHRCGGGQVAGEHPGGGDTRRRRKPPGPGPTRRMP